MKGTIGNEETNKQNDNKDVFLREFAGSLKEFEKRKVEKKKVSLEELFEKKED